MTTENFLQLKALLLPLIENTQEMYQRGYVNPEEVKALLNWVDRIHDKAETAHFVESVISNIEGDELPF